MVAEGPAASSKGSAASFGCPPPLPRHSTPAPPLLLLGTVPVGGGMVAAEGTLAASWSWVVSVAPLLEAAETVTVEPWRRTLLQTDATQILGIYSET